MQPFADAAVGLPGLAVFIKLRFSDNAVERVANPDPHAAEAKTLKVNVNLAVVQLGDHSVEAARRTYCRLDLTDRAPRGRSPRLAACQTACLCVP